MLNVLLESKAKRTRRTGGTIASALAHAALIAGAITLTTRNGGATLAPPGDIRETRPVFVTPNPPAPKTTDSRPTTSAPPAAPVRRLPTIDRIPDMVSPPDLDLTVRVATDDEIAHAPIVSSGRSPGGSGGSGLVPDGVLEERYVDRSPRILGSPISPEFPTSLRQRGVSGRVSIQFVVDTLGRAEMGSLRVVESSDPLFAQSVRAVLGRYRFSPGEVGGQKVRTLVQLPFDFTLVR